MSADRCPPFKFSGIALALSAAMPLSAVALDNSIIELDTVVVSASGYEQKITEAPASISVISGEELAQKRYSNLAQALEEVEGIDIRQGSGKTGGLNISIRGMPSEYTLVLIDGRRQNTGGNVTPNGFNETATSFIPPLSAIERIEVIRGPMSTLYGSDAIGGVINIITKKVADEWAGSITVDHTFQENRDYGDSGRTNLYASGPLVKGLLGLAIKGSVYDREASDLMFENGSVVNRRGAAAVDGRTHSLGARLSLTPHDNHDFYLDYESWRQVYNNDECQLGNLDGYSSGSNTAGCSNPNPSVINGYKDELRFERDQIALGHSARFDFGTLDSTLTHNQTETLGRTIPGTLGQPYAAPFDYMVAGDDRKLKSTDIVFDTKLVSPVGDAHVLTVGGQYWDAKVEDGIAGEDFEQTSWALFVEDEWRLLDSLALTLGARYEDHDAFGGHVSPRAYLVWNAAGNWTLKGGVARGYRTPTVNELHDGISSVGGQGTSFVFGNPDLDPEVSTNTEFGVYYDNYAGFNANLTLFHNEFKDKIEEGTPLPNCRFPAEPNQPGCVDYGPGFTQETFSQTINIGKAETQGVELAATWQFAPRWSLSGNYTYTDSEQKSGTNKGAPLTNTPEHAAYARLNWKTTDRLTLWFKGEYRGERARFIDRYENLTAANKALADQLGDLKAYSVFHLGGTYKAAENVTLTATIYNLFDKDFLKGQEYVTNPNTGATSWASYYIQSGRSIDGTLEEGRRLWLSANVSF